MPPDGILALDNGMYKIWFARNYRTQLANTLLLDNAQATMGAGLPSAIMAALRSLARTWASELRDRKIRVNVMTPLRRPASTHSLAS